MTFRVLGRTIYTETLWWILSAIFFTIGVIGGLGEWVFHWWEDPWDWASPLSLGISGLTIIWGASSRDVRSVGAGLHALRTEVGGGQDRIVESVGGVKESLSEVKKGQDRLAEGQERIAEGQRQLIEGQAEQTSVLREVVNSFRRR